MPYAPSPTVSSISYLSRRVGLVVNLVYTKPLFLKPSFQLFDIALTENFKQVVYDSHLGGFDDMEFLG